MLFLMTWLNKMTQMIMDEYFSSFCVIIWRDCHPIISLLKRMTKNNELYVNDTKNQHNNAINVINSILEKFNLFLAYQTRWKCQLVAISSAKKCMKKRTLSSGGGNIQALIIIDFKL